MQNNLPKLGPIIIGVNSIQDSKNFYVNVFGMNIQKEDTNYLSGLLNDGTHIELEEDSNARFSKWKERNVGTFKNSEFTVRDIFKFLENVEKYGGKIISSPVKRPWGGYGAEFSDFDENIFLITQS